MGRIAILLALATGCGWTQYAGNGGRTGFAPLETTLTTANVGLAQRQWLSNVNAGAAVVANGFVYASYGGLLRAWKLDQLTDCSGTPRACAPTWWSYIPGAPTSEPVVVGNSVFVATVMSTNWQISSFNATGAADCTSAISGCRAEWTGSWGVLNGPAYWPLLGAGEGSVFV